MEVFILIQECYDTFDSDFIGVFSTSKKAKGFARKCGNGRTFIISIYKVDGEFVEDEFYYT